MLDHATDLRLAQRTYTTTFKVIRRTTANLPENPFHGQLVYDITSEQLKLYNTNTDVWDVVSNTGGGVGGSTTDVEEWIAGTEQVPSIDTGNPGDFYLNDAGDVLEKQLDGWVFLFNLKGDPGPPGSGGGGFTHTQTTPSASWTITHNLNAYPPVVVLVGGEQVYTDVAYVDANTVSLSFPTPTAGAAYL